jgi:hypothetical protein
MPDEVTGAPSNTSLSLPPPNPFLPANLDVKDFEPFAKGALGLPPLPKGAVTGTAAFAARRKVWKVHICPPRSH